MKINKYDNLNYEKPKYNPVQDFAKWYEENGKHNDSAKPAKPQSEIYAEQIEKGNLDNVPSIMKIAYGLEKLQKTKEAEQAKRNAESDQ